MPTRSVWLDRGLMLSVLFLASCGGTMMSGGIKVDQGLTEDNFGKVKARAAFDFGCQAEKVEAVVIAADGLAWSGGQMPSQIGASGCGHKGVYVRTPSGWVLNSDTGK